MSRAYNIDATLLERLDACLPQTQCRRCGYAGCLPYARALIDEGASIDLCPPGGEDTRRALARLLGRPAPTTPLHREEPPRLARIEEPDCIGCTKCIQACPVDAIIGAAGLLHGVVGAWCTGCALCVPACPTDCIVLEPLAQQPDDAAARATAARARYLARNAREHAAEGVCAQGAGAYLDVSTCTAAELGATVLAAVRRRRARASDAAHERAPR
ncbi:MAG: RnfABCDGE type electron transport complex subunit B [Gammaproteobacteria bacterium]